MNHPSNPPRRSDRRATWFLIILLVSPVLMLLGLLMGGDWRHPGFLFEPQGKGLLVARSWRVLLGGVTGASLSAAGVVLQAVLRNPLAEPFVLGLSSGAGLAAALCILGGGLALGGLFLPASGFAGALISLAVVYSLARVGRHAAPASLLLAGVIWGSLCGSALMFLVSQSSAEGLHAILWWFLGDLQVYDASLISRISILMIVVVVGLTYFARDLNALLLGDEMSQHVGLNVERSRIVVLSLAALLTASAVSTSGMIGFVGLVIPHAMRSLVGADHRRLIPAAALSGGAFLVLADGLGRMLFYPVEVPVGIITSLVGGPFFLYLLRRKNRELWSGA
ncbi:MAG: iron ABC transporter permease [Lentisphaerota bacterium]